MKSSRIFYILGMASIVLSAINFLSGKSKQSAETQRDGLFTGHWAPTFFILGKVLEDREAKGEEKSLHL